MRHVKVYLNIVLIMVVSYIILDTIPYLISAKDTLSVVSGFGVLGIGACFLWIRLVDIKNSIFKKDD